VGCWAPWARPACAATRRLGRPERHGDRRPVLFDGQRAAHTFTGQASGTITRSPAPASSASAWDSILHFQPTARRRPTAKCRARPRCSLDARPRAARASGLPHGIRRLRARRAAAGGARGRGRESGWRLCASSLPGGDRSAPVVVTFEWPRIFCTVTSPLPRRADRRPGAPQVVGRKVLDARHRLPAFSRML